VALPTQQIGSIPRPAYVLDALSRFANGELDKAKLDEVTEAAVNETIDRLIAIGSPQVTDGEQSKSSFATYPLTNLTNLAPDGVVIPFADGHQRQLPLLTGGPFRYGQHAVDFLTKALAHSSVPVKQAVIAPSALSLLYPAAGIGGYSRDAFIADLLDEAEADIRQCLDAGADVVQLDFTEGRLSLKLDPSGGVLDQFVELNNQVLARFSAAERARIGLHTCPGGDQDSTHSLDVDYADLLPKLFGINVGNVYVQLASEADPERVLRIIAENLRDDQRIFVGVIDPIDPVVETPEQVRDRVLAAARQLPPDRLGSTDDCGFSPFADDTSTSRETAFAKIAARIQGTQLASEALGV
jgi:5-methyltetrahydropteroyltriglutamate--homocysteine methyltransferase